MELHMLIWNVGHVKIRTGRMWIKFLRNFFRSELTTLQIEHRYLYSFGPSELLAAVASWDMQSKQRKIAGIVIKDTIMCCYLCGHIVSIESFLNHFCCMQICMNASHMVNQCCLREWNVAQITFRISFSMNGHVCLYNFVNIPSQPLLIRVKFKFHFTQTLRIQNSNCA